MSGEHTPTTPIDNEEDGPTAHISPSFDYHEERRLHLKDEIWLSHHLPRLPPSAISDAESSLASSSEPPKAIPERRKSVHIPGGGDVPDPRAAAFPRGSSIPKADGEWLSRTPETERRYQHISAAQAFPGSSIVSPSGPEYGDLDPAASLIHRQELDSQERLDLEEEARERELSSAEAALVGLNLGTQPFGAGSRGQPVNMPPEAGEYFILLSGHPSAVIPPGPGFEPHALRPPSFIYLISLLLCLGLLSSTPVERFQTIDPSILSVISQYTILTHVSSFPVPLLCSPNPSLHPVFPSKNVWGHTIR